jgi:hypothetical protein
VSEKQQQRDPAEAKFDGRERIHCYMIRLQNLFEEWQLKKPAGKYEAADTEQKDAN